MPAEVDRVLPLGPRVASQVDLANRTGHTGIGRGAEARERWETEAEGCIDGTGGKRAVEAKEGSRRECWS